MKTSANAKALLLISLIAVSAATSAAAGESAGRKSALPPKLECGTYEIAGRLKRNANGSYLLSVNKSKSSHFELILLGGDLNAKMENVGACMTAEVYVPRPIVDPFRPQVFLQRFLPKDQRLSCEKNTVKKIADSPCGLSDRFQK